MVNWYKQSVIETYEDRNGINARIKEFKSIIVRLESMSKAVFQNASKSSGIIKTIHDDKKISSFPNIKGLLHEAYVKALDNPRKTADLCIEAVDLLVAEMEEMEEDRRKFTEETNPKHTKERSQNAK